MFFKTGNLKILQYPQENACVGPQHRCFPVNIAKFLRTASFYRTPLVAASESPTTVK